MTNYERFQKYTPKELSEHLEGGVNCQFTMRSDDTYQICPTEPISCEECCLQWLLSEVKT